MTTEPVYETLESAKDQHDEERPNSSHYVKNEDDAFVIPLNSQTSKISNGDRNVSLSLARGRAILADAEAHLQLYNEFVHHQDDENLIQSNPLHDAEKKAFDAQSKTKDIVGKSLTWQRIITPGVQENSQNSLPDSDTSKLFEKDRKSIRADICAEITAFTRQIGSPVVLQSNRTNMKKFDPSQLNVTKRASLHRKNLPKDESIECFSFKALPLPGGKLVKSNIFAQTKAVIGKKIQKNEQKSIGAFLSPKHAKKRPRQMKIVHHFTAKEISVLKEFVHKDEVNDPNDCPNLSHSTSLRRDINRLKLLVGRSKTIAAYKLNLLERFTNFDLLDFDSYSANELFEVDSDSDHDEAHSICLASLYERQQKWALARKRRQDIAREMHEIETLNSVTGKPELEKAKISWEMAKSEHENALAQNIEEESRRMEEIGMPVECIDSFHIQTCDLDLGNNIRTKSQDKKKVTLKEIEASIQKLSKPRKYAQKKQSDSPKKTNLESSPQNANVASPTKQSCFSRMSDKQFFDMMKSLGLSGIKSKKGQNRKKVVNKAIDGASSKENAIMECYASAVMQQHKRSGDHSSSKNDTAIFPEKCSMRSDTSKSSLLSQSNDVKECAIATASSALCIAEMNAKFSTNKVMMIQAKTINCKDHFVQPYQRYEANEVPFFDRTSSTELGRFRVRDALGFAPESMRRKSDIEDGIFLLVGKKINNEKPSSDNKDEEEAVITIMFEKSVFNERQASAWWRLNKHRFVSDGDSNT